MISNKGVGGKVADALVNQASHMVEAGVDTSKSPLGMEVD